MAESKEARNKALVLKAFDTLFNKHDYAAAERLWSHNCSPLLQISRHGAFFLRSDSLDCGNRSSVNNEFSAVDVRSAVGYQKRNKLSNLFGATGASHGNTPE